MLKLLRRALVADDGATLVEYALIIGLLALAVLAGVSGVGGVLKNSYNTISSSVGNA